MKAAVYPAIVGIISMSLGVGVGPAHAASEAIVSDQQVSSTVTVSGVQVSDGVVSGVVANRSPRLVRNVELLIRYAWLWHDERHPGDDSPGRADYYKIRADIPPGQTAAFTYRPQPPLPHRTDGRFQPSVQVTGFTEVGE